MRDKLKFPIYEHILFGIAFLMLIVPLFIYIYFEPEIDQLESAFILTAKIAPIPYLVLFSVFFYFKQIDLNKKIFKILQFSLFYSICSVVLLMHFNMHIGSQKYYIIDGKVVSKKPGKGGSKASLTVDTGKELISFRLPRSKWDKILYGEHLKIPVKKGSLGLLYK